jgi:hypothetical protein
LPGAPCSAKVLAVLTIEKGPFAGVEYNLELSMQGGHSLPYEDWAVWRSGGNLREETMDALKTFALTHQIATLERDVPMPEGTEISARTMAAFILSAPPSSQEMHARFAHDS